MPLVGHTCVVTGASSGIGRAIALALVDAGAAVWAVGRNGARLEALVSGAGGTGAIVPVVADLEDDRELDSVASAVLAGSDRVDVLVHSAGAITVGALDSLTAADLDREYRVNLRAPFELTRTLMPALRRSQGQLVFLNSSAALRAGANNVSYAATKAGLKALADGVRADVNAAGVRVTTVYLGRTATPMQEAVHEREVKPYRPERLLRPEDVAEIVVSSLSMPRSGEVTDLHIRPMSKPLEDVS